jgi:HlyD family secretion protein
MRAVIMKRITAAAVLGVLALVALWFAWPQPIAVDLATVMKGPMEVTIDDEAKTRVRHVYTVSAPITGTVLRISPPRHVGDQVTADETIVAVMQPTIPSFHDARTHEELQAALAAAEAAVKLAEAELSRIEAALAFSRTELQRAVAQRRSPPRWHRNLNFRQGIMLSLIDESCGFHACDLLPDCHCSLTKLTMRG